MLPLRVVGKKCSLLIYALLDEGSTVSLINDSLVQKIGADTKSANITLRGIGECGAIAISNKKLSLRLEGDNFSYLIHNILSVKNLALPFQNLPDTLTKICENETGIFVKPYNAAPDLLIGQDNIDLIITRKFLKIERSNMILSQSLLGWSLHGDFKERNVHFINMVSCLDNKSESFCCQKNEELYLLMNDYFKLESLGVGSEIRLDDEKERALRILSTTKLYANNHWEVGLLWKADDLNIPESRQMAFHRLRLLEKKLDRDSSYAELYYKEMDRLFELGFAVEALEKPKNKNVWYLPHFGVKNINKPGKVRLVFDAAAKAEKVSFNDLLLAGPDLYASLLGILMRFRQHKYAVKSDLRDMFLKIKIIKQDQDAQRFLWRGKDRNIEPKECIMTSMFFGSKSSPCTALYIKNENAKTFSDRYPKAVKRVLNSFYMDDYLDSFETIQEAISIVNQVKEINSYATWEMHSWASNSSEIMKNIFPDNAETLSEILSNDSCEKILGLNWFNSTDELGFKLNKSKTDAGILAGSTVPTRREFLSFIMSVFDPLGFLTPLMIRVKILMSDICSRKIGWDVKIDDSEFIRWKRWLFDFQAISRVKIPRFYQLNNDKIDKIELHVFGDASNRAYSAVAYSRFCFANGSVVCSLIMSKSRVCPASKEITIPRLELQAALLAVRVAKIITNEQNFKIHKKYFWSDSKIVLHWIRKDPRDFKVYVMNRLGEIRKNSDVREWKWVPSADNPADDGTRENSVKLDNHSRWFVGPEFLYNNEIKWPKQDLSDNFLDDEKEYSGNPKNFVSFVQKISFIDFSRFSTWNRLLKAVSTVYRAVNIWMRRSKTPVDDRQDAELLCIKLAQNESFASEINDILNNGSVKSNSRIANLNPFIDKSGVLRSNGRLIKFSECDFPSQPVILDAKSGVTRLLIMEYHEKYYHGSHQTVMNEIRQKFWIVGLRQGLRSLVSKCVICKFIRANPSSPKMSALPTARLGFRLTPFFHCGIDYFGPMLVKVGRRREKRWGVLFTCLSVRAVHIELASSLNTDSAIMAIQRFIARRGVPGTFYSDNGTNFKAASKELLEAIISLDQNRIELFCTKRKITWKFNPPTASHMGGAWERLIRSVKAALNTVLKDQAPKEEVLLTTLTEIEHSINSRPLTHVSIDPRDREALTPNHFLIGKSSGEIKFDRHGFSNCCTRKQWLLAQSFADAIWRRWLREYLPTLTPRAKWLENEKPLQIGDMVLILDNNLQRNCWKKGVIIRVYPATDGQVRIVDVKTANGILKRPSRKLVKFLEVQDA